MICKSAMFLRFVARLVARVLRRRGSSMVLRFCAAAGHRLLSAPVFFIAFMLMAGSPAKAQTSQANTSGIPSLSELVAQITGQIAGQTRKQPEAATDERTRFVIEVAKAVEFQVFALSGPDRVIVDMQATRMRLPQRPGKPVGVIKDFRAGVSSKDRSRVVIDVMEPVVIDRAVLKPASAGQAKQIVLDILPTRVKLAMDKRGDQMRSQAMGLGIKPVTANTASVQPPLPRQADTPSTVEAQTFKPLIVIDPGHGGKDSGAMKYGVQEKAVVLKFSHALRRQLEATGRYRVKMTRSDDTFVPLGERRAFAERNKAALFMSVHANYFSSSRVRGAAIFSLRSRVAARLRKSARAKISRSVLSSDEERKIRKASANVSTIRKILGDLAAREVDTTRSRTRMFTQSIIRTMSERTKMYGRPDQEAGFKVLKTAKVPSVLIELAFVSNRRDARLLTSKRWRRNVAGSIVDAVDNYFSHRLARLPL